MSAPRLAEGPDRADAGTASAGSKWPRRLALLGGVVLIGSFLSVLYGVTEVVGGTRWLVAVVGVALVAGTVAARTLPLEAGLGVGALLLAGGLGVYLLSIPEWYAAVSSLRIVTDFLALAFGELTLLRIVRADVWAIAVAPSPVFGTWYLLLRRRYELSAWVGGLALGFVLLTGDAGELPALLGVTSAFAVLGFGILDRSGATLERVRELGILLAVIVVVARLARPVTARALSSGRSLLSRGSERSRRPTIEESLLDASGRVGIRGSISLSPAVRFTVTADRPSLWHVAAYDRFTGDGWVRSGTSTEYDGTLEPPPGDTRTIRQRFELDAPVEAMPAAWKPVRVGSAVVLRTRVTDPGGLQPTGTLSEGESYSVTSERPEWTESRLRAASGPAPEPVRSRYLQLPGGVPDRLGEFAAELTADAETRFEKAAVIKSWLEENRAYSLEVTRPDGNVADAFVFEMDRGYCVYFATAMAVMLRTLDVPARFAVGYSTGQRVSDGEWVVRGFNSHAWVDVYFPDIGWVTFDPTPGGPRQAARERRLRRARHANASDVDTAETRPTDTSQDGTTPEGRATEDRAVESPTPANSSRFDERAGALAAEGREQARLQSAATTPEREETGVTRRSLFADLSGGDRVALVAGVLGGALGVSKFGMLERGLRFAELNWQPPTESPQADVERAFDRLEAALAVRYRERRDGETRREYIGAIQGTTHRDDRLDRMLRIYERAVYNGDVSRATADEAREIATRIVREHSLVARLILSAMDP